MENDSVNREINHLEAEKTDPANIYAELLNRMTTYDEEMRNCLNEIVLLRMELMKANLDTSKLKQELEQKLIELDSLKEKTNVDNERIDSDEESVRAEDQLEAASKPEDATGN